MNYIKRNLIWSFVYQYGYILTNIISSILLLPIYINKIDSTILGIWLIVSNLLTWLTIADPGIADVLQQKIAQLKGENQNHEISKVIGSGLVGSMLIFIIVTLLGLLFFLSLNYLIAIDISIHKNLKFSILISIISTSIMLFSYGLAGINLGLLYSKHIANSYISGNVLFFVINIILLYLNYGIISIAIANLVRTIYVTLYGFAIMFIINKNIVEFNITHFKEFIKIFTFTSGSKLLSTVSSSIDLIILAKFIPVNLITIFEINRRPLRLTQGLAGRYSVALMPFFSHLKGVGNKDDTVKSIIYHFKLYMYITLFLVYIYSYNYEDIIKTWIDKSHYLGNRIIFLMIVNFFFEMIAYFLSNLNYALGDIKINSVINIIKNIFMLIFSIGGVYIYGVEGLVIGSLIITLLFSFFTFLLRLIKLGFLNFRYIYDILRHWVKIVPILSVVFFLLKYLNNYNNISKNNIINLIFNCIILSFVYMFSLYIFDNDIRNIFRKFKLKYSKSSD